MLELQSEALMCKWLWIVATKIIEFTHWLQKIKETNSDTDVSKKLPLRSKIGAIVLSPTDNLGGRRVCTLFFCCGFGSLR